MSSTQLIGVFFLIGGLSACGQGDLPPVAKAIGGDPERGKVALQQYACTGCHVIPGVVGANSHVGPSLERLAKRIYIAGVLPNTPENLIRWLKEPQKIAPMSAMPDLNVRDAHARDMAAYLYTLQ
jgi:cytochrome c2